MGHTLFHVLRELFARYGYGAVFVALLAENAGIPVPGETVLLFASFLAFSQHRLSLPLVIVCGIVDCTLGDNLGYFIGHRGGRPLLEKHRRFFHIHHHTLQRGERLFQRYGAATIFFARFVFGMRVIAGPLAGVLRMPWRKFVLFNFLGACVWVTVIASVGYAFGSQWERLLRLMNHLNIVVFVLALLIAIAAWGHFRSRA